MVRAAVFLIAPIVLLLSLSKVLAEVVHDGFISEVVTSTKAMSGSFMPNPRNGNKPMMILNAKNGQINVLEDPDESPDSIEIMDLSKGPKMCNNGERGLHSVIPSPNFTENRHVFAFFTKYEEDCLEDPEDGPHNVVMRFSMDPETLMLDYDEGTLIFRGPPTDERLHNGGAMAFGNDGKLYITTGDAGKRQNAGTFDDVHGSIIRLNEDGTLPDDNPYTKASGYLNSYRCADTAGRVPKNAPDDSYCAEVWANGLRNPFRIDMDPSVKDKVKFSFGVVGAQHIESIYYGGTDYKGTNYGWPKYEGVCYPGDINNCKPNNDPSITMPFHWYEHISYEDGGCIGGQVHVPKGIWPPEFKYLFIDFILLKIYSLEEGRPDLGCDECSPPLPPTRNETFYRSIRNEGDNINEARLVEMWFGPYKNTQALYFTKFGNHDTVIRIRYNGILNKPPKPAFDFNYDRKVTVKLDAGRTVDPENDDLTYQWDFGDDSPIVVDEVVTSHMYGQPGEYAVTLKVSDTWGQEQQVSKTIKIGTVPKVKILSPSENTTFTVGQKLLLNGEAVDFLGNPIPDERLTWEVRQHHADHFHPFLDPTNNNNFKLFAAPEPEDYLAAMNSFLKVVLTAEDEYGLSETVSVDVQPHIIMVNVTTMPPGLDVLVDAYYIETPQIITSWRGFKLPVSVADQPPYLFKEWSDGRLSRTRVFPIYQKPDEPLPQVQAVFCGGLGTRCVNHGDCCSGYCINGIDFTCAALPPTRSPTASPSAIPTAIESTPTISPAALQPPPYVWVPDPPSSDLEINVVTPPYAVDNGRLPPDFNFNKPIMDEESPYSDNVGVSISLSDNHIDGSNERKEDMDMISTVISYLSISVALLAIFWFVVKCRMFNKDKKHVDSGIQKSYFNGEPPDATSDTGSDEYYNVGRNIKATGTGSTAESQDKYNPASPISQNDDSGSNDISLSFMVPESLSSESRCIYDVEQQVSAATRSPVSASGAKTYLILPPLSPAFSIKNPKSRRGDDFNNNYSTKMKGLLEYRFDAASTSQSSLILPPESDDLGQKSFDDGLKDRSVSLFISSPEKHTLPPATEQITLPAYSTVAKVITKQPQIVTPLSEVEESFEERNLEETSEAIESLILDYLSEIDICEDGTNEDTLTSILPPVHETDEMSEGDVKDKAYIADEIDEDEHVLDLLLVDYSDIEKELILKQNDEVVHTVQEDDASGSLLEDNFINSIDPTMLTEDFSLLSQMCIASLSDETVSSSSKSSQFTTKTDFHENSESTRMVDLSPLKSPTVHISRPRATKHISFMSPLAYDPQEQQEKETPETLSMSYDAADSSVDNSIETIELQTPTKNESKPTSLNLESSFIASVNDNQAATNLTSLYQSVETDQ